MRHCRQLHFGFVGRQDAHVARCGAGVGRVEYAGTRLDGATRGDWHSVVAWRNTTAGTLSVRFFGGNKRLPVLRLRDAA